MTRLRWIVVVAGLLVVGMSFYPHAERIRGGRYGRVHIVAPNGEARGVTILFSDGGGWNDRDQRAAGVLASQGVLAVGVDSPQYLSRISAEKASCQNLMGDVASVSGQIERRFNKPAGDKPLVAGFGLGGIIARKITEQAAPNTVLGFVAAGVTTADSIGVPLCKVDVPATDAENLGVHETLGPKSANELAAVILKGISVKGDRSERFERLNSLSGEQRRSAI